MTSRKAPVGLRISLLLSLLLIGCQSDLASKAWKSRGLGLPRLIPIALVLAGACGDFFPGAFSGA